MSTVSAAPAIPAVGRSGPSRTRTVGRKVRRALADGKTRLHRALARTVYSLPGLSRRDPRRNVITFKDYCAVTHPFPQGDAHSRGDWYLSLRAPETIPMRESIAIRPEHAAAFAAGIHQHQGGMQLELTEVFLASVRDAKIYSNDFLLLSRDNKIFFESALSRRDYLEASGILDRLSLPKPRRLAGEYCLLATRSLRGYYHWLFDILPKLSLVERFPALDAVPLILPETLCPFQAESLQLAGVVSERIAGLGRGLWQTDRVYFPEILGPVGLPSPHAISWLRDRFLKNPAGTRRNHRRIYLTRRDATQRRVLNEPELIAFLSRLGFEVVCPGDLTFSQQVDLFRDVEIVIGPHGAGFSNMVFAPRGATLIEFFGENYINGCFWAVANQCRQRHAFLVGPATWLDYEIRLADLETLFSQLGIE